MSGRSVEGFKPIGRRMAELRTASAMTQRELAERLGKPASYVAKMELAERRLDLLDLDALAQALDIPVGELAELLLARARGSTG